MTDYRTSSWFWLWSRLYESLWGGLKEQILPNTEGLYRIRGGPGRGIRVLTNPAHGGTRVLLGLYEPCLMKWLVRTVKPGSIVYDVGSASGHEALIAAKLAGPDGLVFAFEPDEAARGKMEINLEANPDLAKRTRVLPFLVGNRHDPGDGMVTIDRVGGEFSIPYPDVVKIDVEGAECKVLEGMERLAQIRCPHAFVECHVGPDIEGRVRGFFARHRVPVRRSSPSFFEVSRRGYNAWVWTKKL